MKKSLALGSALLILFSIPFLASAQTADDLRAQILELLKRVETLQQQAGGVPSGIQSGVGSVAAVSAGAAASGSALQCPHISRTLRPGATGDDVSRLQRFLALDPVIYPEAQITGYYGSLTEAAVKRFQCKNKIVCEGSGDSTGYGVTGPRTAAILALQCPDIVNAGDTGGGTVGGFIRVSPVSGVAPLTTAVQVTVNTTNSCTGATYVLNYGDGTPTMSIPVASGSCQPAVQTFNHTYLSPGTFTVGLSAGIHSTSATVNVAQPAQQPVTQTSSDSFSASATSGSAPLTVTFSGVANGPASCNVGSYTLVFGDGQSASIPVSGCTPISYNVEHTYSSGGNFTATLYPRSSASGSSVGSVSIAVSGGSTSSAYTGAFTIAPSASGAALSIQVSFELEKSCSAYDLDWGDSTAHASQAEGSCSGNVVQKNFTHQYASSGFYTVTLKRGSGLSDVDVAAVSVSN